MNEIKVIQSEPGKEMAMGLVLTTGTGMMADLGVTLTGILASLTTTEVAKIEYLSACRPLERGTMSTTSGMALQYIWSLT